MNIKIKLHSEFSSPTLILCKYLEDVGIDGVIAGYDVGLDDVHHGILQVHLTLAASHHPGVPVDLLQGEPLVRADLYHASQ